MAILPGYNYQGMSGTYHFLIDSIQDLWGEQSRVVLDRLQFVGGLVRPVAVSEYLAEGVVLIGQFVNASSGVSFSPAS